ncbi:MAG TPA: phosphoribosyltransferase [Methylococcaceae bacterium]|nr:phosphoribosyltransferase [Methylococcaceae bacterium]
MRFADSAHTALLPNPKGGEPIWFTPDPGWNYNPGRAAFTPDLSRYDPKLAEAFRAEARLLDAGRPSTLESMDDHKPARTAWNGFPDVSIQASESAVKQHPQYAAAKSGEIDAAFALVIDTLDVARIGAALGDSKPVVAGVQAVEGASVNVIPEVMAAYVAQTLGLPVDAQIVQINRVGHTGASGFHRLATPALFDGAVESGKDYVLMDDFVGQGGTLANLRGHIEQSGGRVILAVALTGKPFSSRLALSETTLQQLRAKHGPDLENWWRERFGYGFELLTESEARYLLNTQDADTVRARILADVQTPDS